MNYLALYADLMGLACALLIGRVCLLPPSARMGSALRHRRLPLIGGMLLKTDLWLSGDFVPALGLLAMGWARYAVLPMWVFWRWMWSSAANREAFPMEGTD